MLKLETKSDLQRLIDDKVQESQTLDYKASGALSRDHRIEICKDVSAFANSAGGQIVYGIQEDDGLPSRIDEGTDANIITKEWIEQIIDSNIQPRIEGLRIQPVPLADGRNAYVVTVPQATTYAPHQAPDHRYYFRQNFQTIAGEDYQIRDALRREVTARPYIEFAFSDKSKEGTFDERRQDGEHIFRLQAWLGNESRQPAYYAVITLFISTIAKIIAGQPATNEFSEYTEYRDPHGSHFHAVRKRFSIPRDFPIFQEATVPLCNPPLILSLDYSFTNQGGLPIGYEILTPGHSKSEFGQIRMHYGRMKIDFPSDIS